MRPRAAPPVGGTGDGARAHSRSLREVSRLNPKSTVPPDLRMRDIGTSPDADMNPLQIAARQQIRDGSGLGPGLQQQADAGQIRRRSRNVVHSSVALSRVPLPIKEPVEPLRRLHPIRAG